MFQTAVVVYESNTIGVGFRYGTKSAYNSRFYFGDNIVALLDFFVSLSLYFITHFR